MSAPQTMTLSNTGDASLVVTGVALGAADPQGTALAYAYIGANGTVVPSLSKGLPDANVTSPGGGIYCLMGLAATVHSVVGSSPDFATLVTAEIGPDSPCELPTQATVRLEGPNGSGGFQLTAAPFMIVIN